MTILTFPATIQEQVVQTIKYRPLIEDITITIKVRDVITEEQFKALKEMGVGYLKPVEGMLR